MKDIRDPKELGDLLTHPELKASAQRGHGRVGVSMCEVYDYAAAEGLVDAVADYSPDESTVGSTMAQYKEEMTDQAAKGDTAARIVCAEHRWAYVSSCDVQNGSERRADVELEDDDLPVRVCKKTYLHLAHTFAVVAQPGVRSAVEIFRCPGRV